jgi:hypothetical protein
MTKIDAPMISISSLINKTSKTYEEFLGCYININSPFEMG